MVDQIYCELSDCIYHDEDEIHLGEPGHPASNCHHENIKLWDDTSKPCPFYRLDWKKKQAQS
jgi:hypothetical protein